MENSMERWLAHVGFSAHPFAFHEAGRESNLADYFVPSPCFDDIRGDPVSPVTSIVFARRGCGKTAQRKMLQHICRNGGFSTGRALAATYTDFDHLSDSTIPASAKSLLRLHVHQILHNTMRGVADALISDSAAYSRFESLPSGDKTTFLCCLFGFSKKLTIFQRQDLAEKGIHPPANGTVVPESGKTGAAGTIAHLRQACSSSGSPVDLLHQVSQVIHRIGYDALYILVDCLDELSPAECGDGYPIQLMMPLLGSLKVLETRHLAFKFFLPAAWQRNPAVRTHLRRDRVQTREVRWTDALLLKILGQRLAAFGGPRDIRPLCTPDLADRILPDWLRLAGGSPRNLIRIGAFLFSAHCQSSRHYVEQPISQADWEEVMKRFAAAKAPECDPFFPEL